MMLRPTRMARNLMVSTCLAIFCIGATGCLVVSGKHLDESGVRISSSTLDQVVPDHTTESWLIATLGEPSERTAVEAYSNVEILKYEHVETRSQGGAVFLIFAGGSESTRSTVTYFEVIDGIVSRYWTEGIVK